MSGPPASPNRDDEPPNGDDEPPTGDDEAGASNDREDDSHLRDEHDADLRDQYFRADYIPPEEVGPAIKREYRYGTLGLISGLVAIIAGVVLIALGSSGSVDITLSSGSTSGRLVTSSLGVVLVLVGAFIVRATRPHVETGHGHTQSK
jgi:hypothetical protein